MPMIDQRSLLSKLQSIAICGANVVAVITRADVGGAIGMSYFQELCVFMDETYSYSSTGIIFPKFIQL